MKIEEFSKVIEQMEKFYQKEITDEQKQIWYKELRNLDLARFNYIIAQIYRTLKFMPKLADILEINANLGYSQMKKQNDVKKCSKCNGTGYLLYKKIISNGENKTENVYGAVCSCRQKMKYEGWKITDERNRSNFYMPYIEEIEIGR